MNTVQAAARMLNDSSKFLNWVIGRNRVIEIRILADDFSYFGYFNDSKIAQKALYVKKRVSFDRWRDYPRSGEAIGVYLLLNSLTSPDDFLAKSYNAIKKAKTADTTKNTNISSYRLILIDADAKRLAGISSNQAEKAATASVIRKIHRFLRKEGIHHVVADSGNGFHILIPVNISNTDENILKIKSFLLHLNEKFSNDKVDIDTNVSNPARISKLYGTLSCKGSSTPDRPHRYSVIHTQKYPDDQDLLSLIDRLNLFVPQQKSIEEVGIQSKHAQIIRDILSKENLPYDEIRDSQGRNILRFESCPVHTDHDGHKHECSIIVDVDGKYGANCFHDSEKHWDDFKQAIHFQKYSESIIPTEIFDLNSFFLGSDPIPSTDSTATATVTPTKQADSTSNISAILYQFQGITKFKETEYLIPDASLFPKRGVTSWGGAQGLGKTMSFVGGILMPMLFDQPVLGAYNMPKVKTYYIQSDVDVNNFTNRFLLPYGYQPLNKSHQDAMVFLHTQNVEWAVTPSHMIKIIDLVAKEGFKLIVVDNKTTLFTKITYGNKASEESLDLIAEFKKIAIKYDIAIVIMEHIKKPATGKESDIITIHDVLGTSSKIHDQMIGLNPRFDEISNPIGVSKSGEPKFGRPSHPLRPGEGVIIPLKNAEDIERLQFKLIRDDPFYIQFEPFKSIYEKNQYQDENALPRIESSEKMVQLINYLMSQDCKEITLAKISADTHVSLNTSTKNMDYLVTKKPYAIKKSSGGRGRGHKTTFEIIDSKLLDPDNIGDIGISNIDIDSLI